jgi:hypothetical protein
MKSSSRQEAVNRTRRVSGARRTEPPRRPGHTFMTVVLLDEDGAGQADGGGVVGEDPDDV